MTVIGGYLGSGKTTLVNHLLRTAVERIAVLVNDFGEVDIDAALIERDDGDVIALANGCICCSLVDGLASALQSVADVRPRPERLVIEASGVADPAGVAAYGHGPGFALDAVIVLIDAETVRGQAADKYIGDTVVGQLRSADVVVVNKVDLVEPTEAEAVERWLGERVDGAVVVRADRAQVDPAVLFGAVSPDGADPAVGASSGGARLGPGLHERADELFQSWTWTSSSPLTRSAIDDLMDALPDEVVRAKGIVGLADQPGRPHVLQRVGRRWSLRPARAGTDAGSVGGSRLVVIGRRGAIDDGWLDRRLAG